MLKNEHYDVHHHFMDLLRAAGRISSDREVNCIDPTGKKDTVGPVIYLLKLIVRQYGMPYLKAAAEVHEWLIPAQLKCTQVSSDSGTCKVLSILYKKNQHVGEVSRSICHLWRSLQKPTRSCRWCHIR